MVYIDRYNRPASKLFLKMRGKFFNVTASVQGACYTFNRIEPDDNQLRDKERKIIMNKRVSIIVLCLLLLTVLSGCKSPDEVLSDGAEYIQEVASGVDPVGDVKRCSFPEQLGNDATVGEMVDLVMRDTQWISNSTGDGSYYVQIQGTIEDDIPDYRKFGNQVCILAFNVRYVGNAGVVEEDPSGSYWPASSSYSAMYHINACYKIASGITPTNLIWDDNKDTTNPKFPIYSGSAAAPSQSTSSSVSSPAGSNSGQTVAAPSKPQNSSDDMEDIQEARFDTLHAMYVGTWRSYQGGEDTDDDGVLETYPENEVTLVLNDNGTGSIISYGYTRTFTWEAGSTMTGDATGTWDDLEYEYGPLYFDMQMIDDNTMTADLTEDGGTWIVYFRK